MPLTMPRVRDYVVRSLASVPVCLSPDRRIRFRSATLYILLYDFTRSVSAGHRKYFNPAVHSNSLNKVRKISAQ